MGGWRRAAGVLALVLGTGSSGAALAEVTRLEFGAARPAFEGKGFGAAGAYEVVVGTFHGELDPADPHNAIITDLKLAPRNVRGRVEYSGTFQLARPVDPTKRSGGLIYNVVNRGTGAVSGYDEGHVSVISGWQGDIPADPQRQTLNVPVALGPKGKPGKAPVSGWTWARFVDQPAGASTAPIKGGQGRGVPRPAPLSLDTTKAVLWRATSEAGVGGAERGERVPSGDWAFADCSATPFPGKPDGGKLCLKGGFDPKLAYTLSYVAKDPPVLGVGYAATRDLVAFLRYRTVDAAGTPNPALGAGGATPRWVVGTGISQSANLLRSLVHLGLNQSEDGKIVFDGIFPQNSLRQNAMNYRFAAPGGGASLYDSGVEGVVWYGAYTDRRRRLKRASVMDRCAATDTCPKVIEMFGASELWTLRGSPALVGADASADIPLPANVRRFYNPGVTHGGGRGGFKVAGDAMGACLLAANPNPASDTARALLVALTDWVGKGVAPPDSAYPTLARGELVTPEAAMAAFPRLQGVPPAQINPLQIYDAGPGFNAADLSGVMSEMPPKVVGYVPLRVARVGADGAEDVTGVASVLHQAPLGTYLGWNIASSGFAAGRGCGSNGGYLPFARTRAEREASGDPRLSLEERYGDHAGYVAKVKAAADDLVARRLLLPTDAARLVAEAEASAVLR